jgi:hypothetical protein
MEQFSNLIHIMMLGSKGILTLDTYGLLRTLCYFLMFWGSQSHAFSCKHETHDLLTLVSYYLYMRSIKSN